LAPTSHPPVAPSTRPPRLRNEMRAVELDGAPQRDASGILSRTSSPPTTSRSESRPPKRCEGARSGGGRSSNTTAPCTSWSIQRAPWEDRGATAAQQWPQRPEIGCPTPPGVIFRRVLPSGRAWSSIRTQPRQPVGPLTRSAGRHRGLQGQGGLRPDAEDRGSRATSGRVPAVVARVDHPADRPAGPGGFCYAPESGGSRLVVGQEAA
jgi:hypothetical protein